MREEVHSVALRQHIMNEKLPKIMEVFINPSEYKKSKHTETFLDLIEIFGFGPVHIASKIEVFAGAYPLKSAELDYTFRWEGQLETRRSLVLRRAVDAEEKHISALRGLEKDRRRAQN